MLFNTDLTQAGVISICHHLLVVLNFTPLRPKGRKGRERRGRERRQRRKIKIGSKNKYLYKLLDEATERFAGKGNEMLHKRSSKVGGRRRHRERERE